jgi:hypothetical protein
MKFVVNSNMNSRSLDPRLFNLVELYPYQDEGEQWHKLMEFAMNRADEVEFAASVTQTMVNRDGSSVDLEEVLSRVKKMVFASDVDSPEKMEERWHDFIQNSPDKPWKWQENQWCPTEIRSSLKEIYYTSGERWGCEQPFGTTLFRFYLTPEVKTFLRSVGELTRWRSWGGRNLPEDPSFYCGNKLILWTISHENMAFCSTTEDFPISPISE